MLEVLMQGSPKRKRGTRVGSENAGILGATCICWWGGACCSRPESELRYSQVWILGIEGNGQGEASLIVVSTEKILSISIVID
jgi:hypothetical protein